MNIVSTFIETINNVVKNNVASNSAAIASEVSPVFAAAIGLYIVYIMYEILYTQHRPIIGEVFKNIAMLAVVGAFTYNADYYFRYVIPFVMNSSDELSAAITGTSNVANTVDNLWETLSNTMEQFWNEASGQLGMTDFGLWIKVGLMYGIGYIGGGVLVFYTAIFICISKFMIGMVLSVGIVFICFSPFKSTRGMFTSWCGACLNYILLGVFYTIAFGFVLSLIEKTITFDASNVSLASLLTLLLFVVISVYLIEQIGTLCSSLTGGVGINGLTSAANGLVGRAASMSGLRGMMNAGRGLAVNTGRGLASRAAKSVGRLGKQTLGG